MKTCQWLLVLGTAAVLSSVAVACSSDEDPAPVTPATPDSGAADSSAADSGASNVDAADGAPKVVIGTCAIKANEPVCDQCIAEKCEPECEECANTPECLAIWTCVYANCITDSSTPDRPCATKCATDHLSGVGTFGKFFQALEKGCVALKCPTECGQ